MNMDFRELIDLISVFLHKKKYHGENTYYQW